MHEAGVGGPTNLAKLPSLVLPNQALMSQMRTSRKLELPGELWARILRHYESQFGPSHSKARAADLKAMSLVSHLFGGICQRMLFNEISVEVNIQMMDYRNPDFGMGPLPDSGSDSESANLEPTSDSDEESVPEMRPTVEEWRWDKWEKEMGSAVRAERRLALIGTDPFLSVQPRKMVVNGLNTYPSYPADPFERPPEEQALSRAVFDAFHRFRRTLCAQLAAFVNLRRLEVSKHPVDHRLLAAIETHPRLSELRLDFCWFPESTTPLTSITSLSLGQIPGRRYGHPIMLFHLDEDQDEDDHVASAFGLISLDHLEHLEISFGGQRLYAESVFKELLTSTADKGEFRRLRSLACHFDGDEVPTALLVQFLTRTPTLRDLNVRGRTPLLPEALIPPRFLNGLESLSCPFDWARSLVPGRPVKHLTLWAHPVQEKLRFLASTETDLDNLLPSTTMSTSLTALHLPRHPPLAPINLLMPYLAAHFPLLRELEMAIAHGGRATALPSSVCLMKAGPGTPLTDIEDQLIEDGLLEVLERGVREDVDRSLGIGPKPANKLSPIEDRIKAFQGINRRATPIEDNQALRQRSPSPLQASVLKGNATPPPRTFQSEALSESPLTILDSYFGNSAGRAGPFDLTPESFVDVLYLVARGSYTLPRSLESLTFYSCFNKTSPKHYSCSWVTPEMDWRESYFSTAENRRRYTHAVLADLSRVYPTLTEFRHADVALTGQGGAYHRVAGYWVQEQ